MISGRLGRSLWDLCLIWNFTCCYMLSGRNAAPRCKKNTGIGIYMKNHVSPRQKTNMCLLTMSTGYSRWISSRQTISLNDGRHLLCTSPESLWRFRWCHSPQGYNLHLGIPRVRHQKHVQLSPQCRHHLKPTSKFQWTIWHGIISSPPPPNKKTWQFYMNKPCSHI